MPRLRQPAEVQSVLYQRPIHDGPQVGRGDVSPALIGVLDDRVRDGPALVESEILDLRAALHLGCGCRQDLPGAGVGDTIVAVPDDVLPLICKTRGLVQLTGERVLEKVDEQKFVSASLCLCGEKLILYPEQCILEDMTTLQTRWSCKQSACFSGPGDFRFRVLAAFCSLSTPKANIHRIIETKLSTLYVSRVFLGIEVAGVVFPPTPGNRTLELAFEAAGELESDLSARHCVSVPSHSADEHGVSNSGDNKSVSTLAFPVEAIRSIVEREFCSLSQASPAAWRLLYVDTQPLNVCRWRCWRWLLLILCASLIVTGLIMAMLIATTDRLQTLPLFKSSSTTPWPIGTIACTTSEMVQLQIDENGTDAKMIVFVSLVVLTLIVSAGVLFLCFRWQRSRRLSMLSKNLGQPYGTLLDDRAVQAEFTRWLRNVSKFDNL